MSPKPTGHAKRPFCSWEFFWILDRMVRFDWVPPSLSGWFLLSQPVTVSSWIPTFFCQLIRLKEPDIENDLFHQSVLTIGHTVVSDDGSRGQVTLIFSVSRNHQWDRHNESGVENGWFRSITSIGSDDRFVLPFLTAGSDDRFCSDEAETISAVSNLSASLSIWKILSRDSFSYSWR